MEESVKNFSRMVITLSLARVHVNACFVSKLCFGCRIFDFADTQITELHRMNEEPLVRKLNLRRTSALKLLCGRVKVMGS